MRLNTCSFAQISQASHEEYNTSLLWTSEYTGVYREGKNSEHPPDLRIGFGFCCPVGVMVILSCVPKRERCDRCSPYGIRREIFCVLVAKTLLIPRTLCARVVRGKSPSVGYRNFKSRQSERTSNVQHFLLGPFFIFVLCMRGWCVKHSRGHIPGMDGTRNDTYGSLSPSASYARCTPCGSVCERKVSTRWLLIDYV